MVLEMREMKILAPYRSPQCLSHAFYTRSKCHLWYNTALWVGAHRLLFGGISGYSVYKFNRNQVKLLVRVAGSMLRGHLGDI